MKNQNLRKVIRLQNLLIEDQLADGRGVARDNGKVVFVENALQGERVSVILKKKRKGYDEGISSVIQRFSNERVVPRCPSFGVCGGCVWQHANACYQLYAKQDSVLQEIQRTGRATPEVIAPPLVDQVWKYRRRARLGVKFVDKKGRVLVGFREKAKPYVADMKSCEVLHPAIADQLLPLAEFIMQLEIKNQLPQIEASVADNAAAFVFRVLTVPGDRDIELLRNYGLQNNIQIYLQTAGPDSVEPLQNYEALYYHLPAYQLRMQFAPLDFIQIHASINQKMIDQAITWLDPQPEDRVLDLFCGLGNFSLPLARRAGEVVGVEGAGELVRQAQANAHHNGVANAHFYLQDLYAFDNTSAVPVGVWDLVLLDPPRSGAREVLAQWLFEARPRAILYVSCHPGTLARDTEYIVHTLGYRLAKTGVANMFPHTAHIEVMALFVR